MPEILGFESGAFFVEFYWKRSDCACADWHVVAVNCDQRRIFCNTLGVIPFAAGKSNESAKTHAKVCSRLHVVNVYRVWRVLARV